MIIVMAESPRGDLSEPPGGWVFAAEVHLTAAELDEMDLAGIPLYVQLCDSDRPHTADGDCWCTRDHGLDGAKHLNALEARHAPRLPMISDAGGPVELLAHVKIGHEALRRVWKLAGELDAGPHDLTRVIAGLIRAAITGTAELRSFGHLDADFTRAKTVLSIPEPAPGGPHVRYDEGPAAVVWGEHGEHLDLPARQVWAEPSGLTVTWDHTGAARLHLPPRITGYDPHVRYDGGETDG